MEGGGISSGEEEESAKGGEREPTEVSGAAKGLWCMGASQVW